jgi:mannose-6-phosphate isomerase-like protein (cupin superfamily)
MTESRPWGTFEILLEDENCKVKKIVVNSKQKLSLQSHEKRSELWQIISGNGKVTLNENEIEVQSGSLVEIPATTIHRIENVGDEKLIFIDTYKMILR